MNDTPTPPRRRREFTARLSVSMTPAMAAEIGRVAAGLNCGRGDLVRGILEEALPRVARNAADAAGQAAHDARREADA